MLGDRMSPAMANPDPWSLLRECFERAGRLAGIDEEFRAGLHRSDPAETGFAVFRQYYSDRGPRSSPQLGDKAGELFLGNNEENGAARGAVIGLKRE